MKENTRHFHWLSVLGIWIFLASLGLTASAPADRNAADIEGSAKVILTVTDGNQTSELFVTQSLGEHTSKSEKMQMDRETQRGYDPKYYTRLKYPESQIRLCGTRAEKNG